MVDRRATVEGVADDEEADRPGEDPPLLTERHADARRTHHEAAGPPYRQGKEQQNNRDNVGRREPRAAAGTSRAIEYIRYFLPE